jgi:stringent starvation protein B
MTPSRPYLIRAMYDWIVDNGLTPYIVVDATMEGVQVPVEYVEDGRIVLNVSPQACRGLHLENDRVVFSARFSGLANYAKENGKGMVFSEDEYEGGDQGTTNVPSSNNDSTTKRVGKKPVLKIIKST